jgi:aldehyde:ferredoxin oxidoreductase
MSDDKEWFRSVAWSDFIRWATEKREMQAAFLKATGEEVTAESMERFVDWLTIHHWGVNEAPRLMQERLRAKEPRDE